MISTAVTIPGDINVKATGNYGDPDLTMYSPHQSWEEPEALEEDKTIDGHTLFGATEYPKKPKEGSFGIYVIAAVVTIFLVGAV